MLPMIAGCGSSWAGIVGKLSQRMCEWSPSRCRHGVRASHPPSSLIPTATLSITPVAQPKKQGLREVQRLAPRHMAMNGESQGFNPDLCSDESP